jgi:hypothetical protein
MLVILESTTYRDNQINPAFWKYGLRSADFFGFSPDGGSRQCDLWHQNTPRVVVPYRNENGQAILRKRLVMFISSVPRRLRKWWLLENTPLW